MTTTYFHSLSDLSEETFCSRRFQRRRRFSCDAVRRSNPSVPSSPRREEEIVPLRMVWTSTHPATTPEIRACAGPRRPRSRGFQILLRWRLAVRNRASRRQDGAARRRRKRAGTTTTRVPTRCGRGFEGGPDSEGSSWRSVGGARGVEEPERREKKKKAKTAEGAQSRARFPTGIRGARATRWIFSSRGSSKGGLDAVRRPPGRWGRGCRRRGPEMEGADDASDSDALADARGDARWRRSWTARRERRGTRRRARFAGREDATSASIGAGNSEGWRRTTRRTRRRRRRGARGAAAAEGGSGGEKNPLLFGRRAGRSKGCLRREGLV